MRRKRGYGYGYWEPVLNESAAQCNQLAGEELRFS
jgi:hypothetical protein